MSEIPIPEAVTPLLVQGESAVAAFMTFRDSPLFTTERLIVRDTRGITGKKVEIYSMPYSAINMRSSENAGRLLDMNAEAEPAKSSNHRTSTNLETLTARLIAFQDRYNTIAEPLGFRFAPQIARPNPATTRRP